MRLIQNYRRTCWLLMALYAACLHARTDTSKPYASIRYADAFNQDDLWSAYGPLMYAMGCADNVALPPSPQRELFSDAPLAEYHAACMRKLMHARYLSLAEPAMYAIMQMGAMALGTAIVMQLLGKNSAGGSFAGFTAVFDSLKLMKSVIQSGYSLWSLPNNVLAIYEDCYAQNKCTIPRVLWPKIEQTFVAARQQENSQEQHIQFLKFALGLTLCKHAPQAHINATSIDALKREISVRIQQFFSNYTCDLQTEREIHNLILNVAKFIDQLLVCDAAAPRYLYLQGPGGVGKTYFFQQLAQWFDELLPHAVHVESIIVDEREELEGSDTRPGALLTVLRNQLVRKCRGSLVLFDEATWLHDPQMISAAKRTFNLDQAKLSTAYLGHTLEGEMVTISMPPMLILVASNNELTDAALASRFDIVHYPHPSTHLLYAQAKSILATSQTEQLYGVHIDAAMVERWIEQLQPEQRNFRFVAGNLESDLLVQLLHGDL